MSMLEYVTGELGCGLGFFCFHRQLFAVTLYNASCHMCHNQKIVILSNLPAKFCVECKVLKNFSWIIQSFILKNNHLFVAICIVNF